MVVIPKQVAIKKIRRPVNPPIGLKKSEKRSARITKITRIIVESFV